MVKNKFQAGDKVRVNVIEELDEDIVKVGDVFIVEKAYIADLEPKAYIDIITDDGTDWCLYEWQVELVQEDINYHALESAIREVDREIKKREDDLEELKLVRERLDELLKGL